jgi:hypothetical protein
MHCQGSRRATVTPIERPVIVALARALEDALERLPRESAWQSHIDKLHRDLAEALEPSMW